ncbi:hypothetical protein HRbin02_00924 [Candidatus Calditenuaceae archaeon HR02]|nr:hypothetical protein HRbin02_00924 [Candidatus Calditenuaceae archaeon HR02]
MGKGILNFMNSLLAGKFAEAERSLERMEKKSKTPEERRVIHALRGLLNAYQLDDRDSLIYRIFMDADPQENAREVLKALELHLKQLDKGSDGYFEAWSFILKNIKSLPIPHRLRAENQEEAS